MTTLKKAPPEFDPAAVAAQLVAVSSSGQSAGVPPLDAEELELAGTANVGLSCGDPLAFAQLAPGMTVVDLGSGAGYAALAAAQRVGPTGHVIGVDMKDEVLARARENVRKRGVHNVSFRKEFIEHLSLDSNTADYVISNWAINLSADKPAVFREIARILKPGGRFAISDLVLLKPLPVEVAHHMGAYVGCIATASLLTDYLSMALAAGLRELTIPHLAHGPDFVKIVAPSEPSSKPSHPPLGWSAEALASIQLHGKK